jgi:hypothetical protein
MITQQNTKKIKYRYMGGKWKYELLEDYWFNTPIIGCEINSPFLRLEKTGMLYLTKGYAWNGASGPAIDTKTIMRGSLGHDGCYECGNLGAPERFRDQVDLFFIDICRADGMWKARREWVYLAVKTFARRAWTHPDKPPEILEAP